MEILSFRKIQREQISRSYKHCNTQLEILLYRLCLKDLRKQSRVVVLSLMLKTKTKKMES